jgi:hypothetical protein
MFTALLCSIWALKSCKREGGLTVELKLIHITIETQLRAAFFVLGRAEKYAMPT